MAERLKWLEATTSLTASSPDSRDTLQLEWLEPRQSAPIVPHDDGMPGGIWDEGRTAGPPGFDDLIPGGGIPGENDGPTLAGDGGMLQDPTRRLRQRHGHQGSTPEGWNMGVPTIMYGAGLLAQSPSSQPASQPSSQPASKPSSQPARRQLPWSPNPFLPNSANARSANRELQRTEARIDAIFANHRRTTGLPRAFLSAADRKLLAELMEDAAYLADQVFLFGGVPHSVTGAGDRPRFGPRHDELDRLRMQQAWEEVQEGPRITGGGVIDPPGRHAESALATVDSRGMTVVDSGGGGAYLPEWFVSPGDLVALYSPDSDMSHADRFQLSGTVQAALTLPRPAED